MPTLTVDNLVFIWSDGFGISQEIHVPPTMPVLDGQVLLNAIRKAEESPVGMARKQIAAATGKEQLSSTISKGFVVTLLDDWRIFAQADLVVTGADVIRFDGTSPFVPNASITYERILSVASTIAYPGGAVPVTPESVWQYSDRRLSSGGIADIWSHSIGNLSTGVGRAIWRISKLLGLTSESVTAKDDCFVRVDDGSDIYQAITVNPDGSRTLGGSP